MYGCGSVFFHADAVAQNRIAPFHIAIRIVFAHESDGKIPQVTSVQRYFPSYKMVA